ncbi:MAG TPA: PEGA domain-containing protein [Blastocatellia bacterium]|nr:PEGA domain-containing protein [Blastocatellia bacterium]
MTKTRSALLALATLILSAFAACSPAANHNAANGNGNSNAARPAANTNTGNANVANANAANANAAAKSKPGTGTLEIASTPPGAGITLIPTAEDSAGTPQAYGATPATINDLAPGKYDIQLSKPGYKSFQKEVTVKAGAATKVTATLKK